MRTRSPRASARPASSFVRYWLHGQHLLADGLKMAKSEGNAYTLADLSARGFSPAAFRYLCATVHYRARLNFTFRALRAAEHGLAHLARLLPPGPTPRPTGSAPPDDPWAAPYRAAFWAALCDDLHLPGALAALWRLARTPRSRLSQLALALEFDGVLGLGLATASPAAAGAQGTQRRGRPPARSGAYRCADEILAGLREAGFIPCCTSWWPRCAWPPGRPSRGRPGPAILGRGLCHRLFVPTRHLRCLGLPAGPRLCRRRAALPGRSAAPRGWSSYEVIAVDNDADDEARAVLASLPPATAGCTVLRTDHRLGEAEGRNLALRRSSGRVVLLLDTGVR